MPTGPAGGGASFEDTGDRVGPEFRGNRLSEIRNDGVNNAPVTHQNSINGLFISSSNELGAFYAGTMARWLGLVPAVVLGGCAVLGVAGITAWKNPILRRLNLRDLH